MTIRRDIRAARGIRRGVVLAAATGVLSANAAVISKSAVAETFIAVFAVFALLLLVVVAGLVALASKGRRRLAHVRTALLWIVGIGVLAGVVLVALREAEKFESVESAFGVFAILLVVAGVGLVAYAFFASRRRDDADR